jgi:hypothetical protein
MLRLCMVDPRTLVDDIRTILIPCADSADDRVLIAYDPTLKGAPANVVWNPEVHCTSYSPSSSLA